MKNTFKVGQYVELKNDNHNGIGSKGDKAYILAKAFPCLLLKAFQLIQ